MKSWVRSKTSCIIEIVVRRRDHDFGRVKNFSRKNVVETDTCCKTVNYIVPFVTKSASWFPASHGSVDDYCRQTPSKIIQDEGMEVVHAYTHKAEKLHGNSHIMVDCDHTGRDVTNGRWRTS
jgi:hypothetical protein